MFRAVVALALAGIVMSAAGAARAQDEPDDEARALFEQGLQAYESGDVAGAADLFDRSVALRESPPVLYNLAMCRRELGQHGSSITAFQRYVAIRGTALPAEERAEIEGMVREMGGTLETPAPPDTGTPPAGGTTPGQGDGAADDGVDQVWFWVTAGTAVALGIGAGITGGLLVSTHDDFVNGGSTDQDLADKGDTLQVTTNVLAGLAGAAAAAALVLAFFTDFGGEASEEPRDVGVAWVAPGVLVVTW